MSEIILTLTGKFSLPNTVIKLTLEGECVLPYTLPPSVKFLTLGNDFNQDISPLDFCNVEVLKFGKSFNQDVSDLKLSQTLRLLSFSGKFNKSLEKLILPESLEVLILLGDFNSNLPKLPQKLHTLLLGKAFKGALPSVPTLVVGGRFISSSDPRIVEVL